MFAVLEQIVFSATFFALLSCLFLFLSQLPDISFPVRSWETLKDRISSDVAARESFAPGLIII